MTNFKNYSDYLKCVTISNQLSDNSYKVFTKEEWLQNERIEAESQRYS